ncbi:MAG: hypothetical protein RIT27_683 [Pseudomonadota bacterium]|jgi:glycosyltransferase involved in cell wall biosynthesis
MSNRIAMVVFSYYPADPRPRREAEALIDAGFEVDMICLRNKTETKQETVHGVNIYRLPLQKKRGGKIRYLWEYAYFGFLAFLKLTILHFQKKYQIIHVHNMPDVLVFTALIPRLLGTKVILDLHDPMPEVFIAKYNLPEHHFIIRVLRFLEKLSIGFSHQVLTPNLAFEKLFVSRSCKQNKIQVLMNSPDESIFTPRNLGTKSDQFIVMYHGTIVERNGLDTALYAIAKLKEKIPHLIFQVYGEGDFVSRFLEIRKELQLENIVQYYGHTSLEKIAMALEQAHLGVIPNKLSPFTQINMPTRIFECLKMNKPVIAPRTHGILDYFNENNLFFFTPDDVDDLARVMLEIYENPERREMVLKAGIKVFEPHAWTNEKQHLIKLVQRFVS